MTRYGRRVLTEIPFDSARAFHAALASRAIVREGRVRKSSCPAAARVRIERRPVPLDEAMREAVLDRVVRFAERGLRVLLVAEGPEATPTDAPQGLTALGFVAISDPLRSSVPEAIRRCQAAGIRVIMLTGDHPATARAIAAEAGLLRPRPRSSAAGPPTSPTCRDAELDQAARDRRRHRPGHAAGQAAHHRKSKAVRPHRRHDRRRRQRCTLTTVGRRRRGHGARRHRGGPASGRCGVAGRRFRHPRRGAGRGARLLAEHAPCPGAAPGGQRRRAGHDRRGQPARLRLAV